MDEVKSMIARHEDPLRAAVKAAIAGNIIDFAAVETYDLRATIEKVMKQKPAIDDYSRLREEVQSAETLLYFADNAGETVLDKLIIEEMIRARGRPFKKISFVVKEGSIINNATIEDALYVRARPAAEHRVQEGLEREARHMARALLARSTLVDKEPRPSSSQGARKLRGSKQRGGNILPLNGQVPGSG
ncbi:hypothetical protein PABY_13670 [Pyrodictium abyssi]|uniref:Damage-control phosphatase ARMT1-like metal-binding domain-containing protein n=1 Tax=Pyrodictium abyssi TaxID=54256 RepID=A0ABN6ZT11_9CREN|nr:hypothetical protein PABY_13670 [Pyrodictium abyssi]